MGKRKKLALVLNGGGARGAYQAGVLKSWQEILKKKNATFEIVSGVSAGAINAMELVQSYENLGLAVDNLYKFWYECETSNVYEVSMRGLVKNLFKLTRTAKKTNDPYKAGISNSIFNSSPLYEFLVKRVDMGAVYANIKKYPQLCVIVNCFDYTNMKNVAFYQNEEGADSWERPTRRGIPTQLTIKHVVASCSVPLLFPTIEMNGHYYGDGSLRNMAPLNPAIKMDADRIICISLRGVKSDPFPDRAPTMGNVAEAVFDSMFLDAIDYDSQILNRMNILSSQIPEDQRDSKVIEFCRVNPYINFGEIAESFRKKFPRGLHAIMGGWISSELLSYLLFHKDYAKALMDQGEKDGAQYKDHVEEWFLKTD